MNLSTQNISKPTPRIPRFIGNSIIFGALAIQPIIVSADKDVMSDKAKFYITLIVSFVGGVGKGFTMMLADNEELTPKS